MVSPGVQENKAETAGHTHTALNSEGHGLWPPGRLPSYPGKPQCSPDLKCPSLAWGDEVCGTYTGWIRGLSGSCLNIARKINAYYITSPTLRIEPRSLALSITPKLSKKINFEIESHQVTKLHKLCS